MVWFFHASSPTNSHKTNGFNQSNTDSTFCYKTIWRSGKIKLKEKSPILPHPNWIADMGYSTSIEKQKVARCDSQQNFELPKKLRARRLGFDHELVSMNGKWVWFAHAWSSWMIYAEVPRKLHPLSIGKLSIFKDFRYENVLFSFHNLSAPKDFAHSDNENPRKWTPLKKVAI